MAAPQYLTTDELAERFRTKPATVRYWQYISYGPRSIKVGRRRLYPVDAVEMFEQEMTQQAGSYATKETAR